MKRLGFAVAALAIVALTLAAFSARAAEDTPVGQQEFADQKCNLCHGVATVGIEAKTKSDKMKGPDLVGLGEEFDVKTLTAYMHQKTEKDGKQHKKEFKGSDEELQALVDWLLEQKAEG